jgi:nicotinamide-nucleotide amidase
MYAEIITIGNELLYGQIVDKNAQYISDHLSQAGCRIIQITTVADEINAIIAALSTASNRGTQVVIITGGLGPTSDDVTKRALSNYLDAQSTIQQSICTPIDNHLGTAPGICCKRNSQFIIALPGVPSEMQAMLQHTVLPYLIDHFPLPPIYHKTICTIGIAEEDIAAILAPWERQLPEHMQLAYLPDVGTVKIRLTTTLPSVEKAKRIIEVQIEKMLPLIKEYVYGYDEDTIEKVVGNLLKAHHKTLAIAESCSGGYASQLVIQVPGSSAYYQGGIIAYNNTVKHSVLGVPQEELLKYGAVSQETAIEMAQKVRSKFKADVGLSSTGIAGPGGGDVTHPVGTVWIAYADEHTCYAQKLQLTTSRTYNIQLTAYHLLNLLRERLVSI